MILRIIRKVLGLCDHTWEDQGTVRETYGKYTVGKLMVQRCYHCSKFRTVKMY